MYMILLYFDIISYPQRRMLQRLFRPLRLSWTSPLHLLKHPILSDHSLSYIHDPYNHNKLYIVKKMDVIRSSFSCK